MKNRTDARLTEEQVHDLLLQYKQTADPDLRDKVVLQFKPLVESVARRFSGSGEPLEDLIQEGYIGLITATDLYDASKGVKFSTYATHFIIGQIKHALRDKGKIIKEPAWLQELNHRLTKVIESLFQELGRQPTESEIGRVMHLSEETVAEILTTREVFKVASLDSEQDDEESVKLDIEKVKDEKYTVFQLPIEDKIVLETAMNKLKLIEQKVIQDFYYQGLNQTEISKKLGISCNYVSHILRSGTKKLRRILTTEEIKEIQMQLQLASRRPDRIQSTNEPDVVDSVTGVYNKSYLEDRLVEELTRATRTESQVAFAVFAIDGLGDFRARHGTLQYDELICTVADTLRTNVRRCDVVGRLSESEFGIILLYTNGRAVDIARRVSEQVRSTISALPSQRHSGSISLRIGVAMHPEDGNNAVNLMEIAQERAHTSQTKRARKVA